MGKEGAYGGWGRRVRIGCYIRVERSAQLERVGCDQDAWLVGDRASPSGTR